MRLSSRKGKRNASRIIQLFSVTHARFEGYADFACMHLRKYNVGTSCHDSCILRVVLNSHFNFAYT